MPLIYLNCWKWHWNSGKFADSCSCIARKTFAAKTTPSNDRTHITAYKVITTPWLYKWVYAHYRVNEMWLIFWWSRKSFEAGKFYTTGHLRSCITMIRWTSMAAIFVCFCMLLLFYILCAFSSPRQHELVLFQVIWVTFMNHKNGSSYSSNPNRNKKDLIYFWLFLLVYRRFSLGLRTELFRWVTHFYYLCNTRYLHLPQSSQNIVN